MSVAVPDEVSVMGFDDIHEGDSCRPRLTTMHNPLYESGRVALNLLHEQMQQDKPEIAVRMLTPELVMRESCGKPRKRERNSSERTGSLTACRATADEPAA
jgi:DNA-binding LacI/PurR family transcriptional regulator